MRDLLEGLIGAAIVYSIPLVLAYVMKRYEDSQRKPMTGAELFFKHVENALLDKFNGKDKK